MCQKRKAIAQNIIPMLCIGQKCAYFKYRAIFFVIQTICQTYSDVKYKVLYVVLAHNALNVIKDIKLIGVYLRNRYILVPLQKNNITMIH